MTKKTFNILKFLIISFFVVIFSLLLSIAILFINEVLLGKHPELAAFIIDYPLVTVFIYFTITLFFTISNRVDNKPSVKISFRRKLIFNLIIFILLFFIPINVIEIINQPKIEKTIEFQNKYYNDETFTANRMDQIIDYLSFDKEWKVTKYKKNCFKDELVAIFRDTTIVRKNTYGYNLLNRNASSEIEYYARFIFNDSDNNEEIKYHTNPSNNNFFQDRINLDIYKYDSRYYVSNLIIDYKYFKIQIFEKSKTITRLKTNKLFDKINLIIQNCKNDNYLEILQNEVNTKEINLLRYEFLSNWETSNAISAIEKGKDEYYKGKIVEGYVNTGKKGYLYLKVYDKETEQISTNNTMIKNLYPIEFIGWDEELKRSSFFSIPFTYKYGNKRYKEIFELWFSPSDGSGDYKLYNKEYNYKLYPYSELHKSDSNL